MIRRFIPIFCFVFFQATSPTSADEAIPLPPEIGETGSKYQKTIQWRSIATKVNYFDPAAPPPPLKTNEKPREKNTTRETFSGNGRGPWILASAAILVIITYLFVRFGGGLSVSLRRDADNPERGRNKRQSGKNEKVRQDNSLEDILRIDDRRKAVILLAQNALKKSLSKNDILIQDSWTARDALRRIPSESRHQSALRSLVLASELVHFGGRAISEEEFRGHVENIRPLFEGRPV